MKPSIVGTWSDFQRSPKVMDNVIVY